MTLMMIEQLNERSTMTGAAEFWPNLISPARPARGRISHVSPALMAAIEALNASIACARYCGFLSPLTSVVM